MPSVEQVHAIFDPLARGDVTAFFQNVDDDVDWTVKGTFLQIAGHYKSKSALRSGTHILNSIWATPLKMVVQHVICQESCAIVEMKAHETYCKNGMPFINEYVWICYFNKADKIVQVRAYMDTDLVHRAIALNS
ncbi:hypothetical protein CDD81_5922 [Ophiocordyceps australis]|uniref:SnoaL-like domain-containing protein n=1 Tax=Ophiocordyceps australis TaxID=1399860 RepID=A0A2C5YH42_9HYPO|nr:hypothetical protein CDD81_5922 [Ophiocordyceps australis]